MLRFTLMAMLTASAVATSLQAGETSPDGWKFFASRDEIAPTASVRQEGSSIALVMVGNGEPNIDGKWVKRTALPQSPYVRLIGRYRASNVEVSPRNVLASIVWFGDKGKELHNPDFAATNHAADAGGWRKVDQVFKVPEKATEAQVELRFRWSEKGEVEWRDVELKATDAPKPRMVKVASVNHRPRGNKTAQENLEQFAKWIDEAGEKKADIVCLPEAITLIGRGADYLANTETIPGPSTEFLGKVAAKNHLYIVAGLLEKDGKAAYNTSVLIDRDGKLVGKYRKICLPYPEANGGLLAGSETPVFDTDFGKIGMMICWDVSYPEIARELAAKGAEIILMPIWGGNETLCKARAIENQIPLVISSYDLRSAIYNQAGEPTAIAPSTDSTVVYADLNLAEPMNWKWTGTWRDRIWIEGPIRKDATESKERTNEHTSKAD